MQESELIQYILVNKDLNMSPGKIAAQVGHVCTICACAEFDNVDYNTRTKFWNWYVGDQKKIVLQAHEKDLTKLINQGFGHYINDNGHTEVPAGSLTALSLGVMSRKDAKQFVKRFQLLK